MKLKVCGMKHNTAEVAALQPDYLGFIFYQGSPRNFNGEEIPTFAGIKKVGVFVNAPIDFVIEKVTKFNLDVVQLHGEESPHYCASLKGEIYIEIARYRDAQPNQGSYGITDVEMWKVFSVKDTFNFEVLKPYENSVEAFLFDTKGKEKGGNGYTFNWNVLKDYPSQKPFVLSGGIGLEEISAVKEILATSLPIMAIDVNSKFETAPGVKNSEDLKKLIATFK